MDSVSDFFNVGDQDCMQKVWTIINSITELYKITMASLLVVFSQYYCYDEGRYITEDSTTTSTWLPYESGIYYDSGYFAWADERWETNAAKRLCTTEENFEFFVNGAAHGYSFMIICFALNWMMLFSFVVTYYFEYRREIKLIAYMDVNKALPNTDEAVASAMAEHLTDDRVAQLKHYQYCYKISGIVTLILYPFNSVCSLVTIIWWGFDYNAYLNFFTAILLVNTKCMTIFYNIRSPPHTFFSSYMKARIQYNDVDKDKKKVVEDPAPKDEEVAAPKLETSAPEGIEMNVADIQAEL